MNFQSRAPCSLASCWHYSHRHSASIRRFSRGRHMKVLESNTVESHNTRTILLAVVGMAILATFALLITACASRDSKAATTSSPSVPVDAVKVRQEDVPLVGVWVGTLDGFVNAQIQP